MSNGYYEATVEHAFRARHWVRLADGTREPPHLHTWRVRATFQSPKLDQTGFVVDFVAAKDALRRVVADMADADLNAIAELADSASAERVAELVARRLMKAIEAPLCKVSVTEAAGCWAAYYTKEA